MILFSDNSHLIVLDSNIIDVIAIVNSIFVRQNQVKESNPAKFGFIKAAIECLDNEFGKRALKGILYKLLTNSECSSIGIKPQTARFFAELIADS